MLPLVLEIAQISTLQVTKMPRVIVYSTGFIRSDCVTVHGDLVSIVDRNVGGIAFIGDYIWDCCS